MSMDRLNFDMAQTEASKKEARAFNSMMAEKVEIQKKLLNLKADKETNKLMMMDVCMHPTRWWFPRLLCYEEEAYSS